MGEGGRRGRKWEKVGRGGRRWEEVGGGGRRWEEVGGGGKRWEEVKSDEKNTNKECPKTPVSTGATNGMSFSGLF